jgi:selenocysteine lyase/cysteine desulfurase
MKTTKLPQPETFVMEPGSSGNKITNGAFAELERGIYDALETYSNVHRGSGYNSMVSTHLYEKARGIVLEYMGLNKSYTVIFCTPRRAEALKAQLDPGSYRKLSGKEIGISLGVTAMAVKKSALPKGPPFQTGGGTAKLVSPDWEIWAGVPDRFEAGTPASFDLIFTSNATEGVNLVAEGLSYETEEGLEPAVITTLLEHSSNDLPWRMLSGYSLIRLDVDDEGFMDLTELENHLRAYNHLGQYGNKRIKLVAVSGASNVLGVCASAVVYLWREKGCLVLTGKN